jgi:hypothetical protein
MRIAGLTKKYKYLQKIQDAAGSRTDVDYGPAMDRIFRQIVDTDIVTVGDVIEKIRFSQYCMTVEEDFVEAARLIDQICRAFEQSGVVDLVDHPLSAIHSAPCAWSTRSAAPTPPAKPHRLAVSANPVAQNLEGKRPDRAPG